MDDVIWGKYAQKLPRRVVNRQFQAKTPKSIHRKFRNISGTINIGANFRRAMVATARGEKKLKTPRAPPCEELDPATIFFLCFTVNYD